MDITTVKINWLSQMRLYLANILLVNQKFDYFNQFFVVQPHSFYGIISVSQKQCKRLT